MSERSKAARVAALDGSQRSSSCGAGGRAGGRWAGALRREIAAAMRFDMALADAVASTRTSSGLMKALLGGGGASDSSSSLATRARYSLKATRTSMYGLRAARDGGR